ncbi:hypothetical protein [Psychromonas aquimarina]|uniref:hypothetical protein n=1 Tax=Psychromonas aquimarina TaxID=444919 RepID=UPI0012F9DA95|nr:hypothetical protein [Psychromonas aquimarina]
MTSTNAASPEAYVYAVKKGNPLITNDSLQVNTITRGFAANQPFKAKTQEVSKSLFLATFRRALGLSPYGTGLMLANDYFINDEGDIVQRGGRVIPQDYRGKWSVRTPWRWTSSKGGTYARFLIAIRDNKPELESTLHPIFNEAGLLIRMESDIIDTWRADFNFAPAQAEDYGVQEGSPVSDAELYETFQDYVNSNPNINHNDAFLNADGSVNQDYFPNLDYAFDFNPEKDLNAADENSCTVNPVNIATGNKFFRITDYVDNSNPLLKLARTYDSADGFWVFNSALNLAYQADVDTYTLTFANGSKGSFVKQGDKWVRYENKIQDYLTKTTSGEVIYHGPVNHNVTFNSAGQVITEQQGNHTVEYSYAGNDDVIITDPVRQRSLIFSFDKQLNTTNITLPNQKQVTYFYDSEGRLTKVSNQGKETSYLHENTAFPHAITKVIDANDKTYKEITYYPDGRVKSSALNAGNELIAFEYPDVNNTLTTNALGKQTTYTFTDIKGVKKVTKVQGHASANCLAANQNYEYYDDGQLKSKTDWKGIKTEFEYNDRGLEKQRTEAAGTKDERVITTTWHDKFNLPETVTVGNQVTTYSYDTNGQLKSKKLSKI